MEQQPKRDMQSSNPRRRTRSKIQNFKEAYLPFLIFIAGVALIIGIVVGIVSCTRDPGPSTDPSGDTNMELLRQEATALLEDAQQLAMAYDFDGALSILSSFSGNISDFPELKKAMDEYTITKHSMVPWKASQVPNLSFHVLIAELTSALKDPTYGDIEGGTKQYNRNFVTIGEFTSILKRLYDNGYVLVNFSDLFSYEYSADVDAYVYTEKELLLPQGKKPFLLTETHCNYYTYMVDIDRDGTPDPNGAGFANKLRWDNGFYNEMVATDGSTVTGALDLVPILENFISLHPDFSYRGARAILALSGYDGIFGYRITSEDLSNQELEQERSEAAALVTALKDAGYTIACYTYENISYGAKSAARVEEDILDWQEKIAPVVGETDILVFAQESDIGTSYDNNEKFDILYENGYRYFLGSSPFLSCEVEKDYVRHTRLMVTGSNLYYHPEYFSQIFNINNLLDLRRNNIPQ